MAIALPVLLVIGILWSAMFAVTRRSLRAALTMFSLTALFAAAVVAPMRPAASNPPITSTRLATMNLGLSWFTDNDAGFVVFQEEPQLLVGAELSESHHNEFSSRFTFHEADILSLDEQRANEVSLTDEGNYRRNGLPSIGVYSDLPLTLLDDPIADVIDGGLPGLRIRVDADGGAFILYAIHIPRPYPRSGSYEVSTGQHLQMVDAIVEAVNAETEPVVVAGDLNTVDRGQGYRKFTASMTDAMRQGEWAVPTADRPLPWSLLFARLDHVLISEGLCAQHGASRDTRFADHRPLVVDVGPCAP